MCFPSEAKVDDIMNTVLRIEDWADEMKLFIMNNNEDELIMDPSKLYVMEIETFQFEAPEKQTMSLLVHDSLIICCDQFNFN